MIVWRVLAIVAIVLLIVLIILQLRFKFLNNAINKEFFEDRLISKKIYKKNKARVYESQLNDIPEYMIYEKRRKRYLMLKYASISKKDLFIFIYKKKGKYKTKKFVDNGLKDHSKLIKIPKNTQYINIADNNESLNPPRTNKKSIVLYSLITSGMLLCALLVLKYISLEMFSDKYFFIQQENLHKISILVLIILPVLFFAALSLSLLIRNGGEKDEKR